MGGRVEGGGERIEILGSKMSFIVLPRLIEDVEGVN